MTFLEALFLGVVQGLTEFMPISSSGHLALWSNLFGLTDPEANLAFNVAVHFGSLAAVLVFARRELREMCTTHPRLLAVLAVATAPLVAVVLATPAKQMVQQLGSDTVAVGVFLLSTALVLALVRRVSGTGDEEHLSLRHALFLGCAQALAILPGVSRSGFTLAAGLRVGLQAGQALRFSFLMAVPAIGGAFLLMLIDGDLPGTLPVAPMAAGVVASFVTSLVAMRLMVGVVARRHLGGFAAYCALVGVIAIVSGVV